MATFRTYAEALRPDHPLMKIHKAALTWRPSRYRPAEIERDMRAEPGVVLADVLQRTGGVYETTTRMTPKFREDIREIAELTSDDRLLGVAELAEVPVSLEHLRHVDRRPAYSLPLIAVSMRRCPCPGLAGAARSQSKPMPNSLLSHTCPGLTRPVS